MKRGLGVFCNILGAVLIAAVILVCLPLTVPRLMGYDVYAIVSGSMEPAIPTGSLVYAKAASAMDVAPEDVIVFVSALDGVPVTHRVVENDAAQKQFITKGDANAAEDMTPVPYANLLGLVAVHVPVLGYFLPAISTMQGKLSLLGVLAAAVVFRMIGGRLKNKNA